MRSGTVDGLNANAGVNQRCVSVELLTGETILISIEVMYFLTFLIVVILLCCLLHQLKLFYCRHVFKLSEGLFIPPSKLKLVASFFFLLSENLG